MKIKISPIIKIEQNNNVFYIGKIKLSELIKCATVFTRERSYNKEEYNAFKEIDIKKIIENAKIIEEEANFGTQRRQDEQKLRKIARYLEEKNGFFPNSFIVSIDPIKNRENKGSEDSMDSIKSDEDIIKVDDTSIEFDNKYAQVRLIDGQHRFFGFEYIEDKETLEKITANFECILTIFINLPSSEQADLFATINSTQKPVNKSILTDLKALSYTKYRIIHVCNSITKWLNERDNPKDGLSLWKGKINMLGVGKGIISQGMFVEALTRLITNDSETSRGLLYEFYNKKEYDKIYFLLKEYFSAWEYNFKNEWGNDRFLLCKTVGFITMMKLFEIIYVDYKPKINLDFRSFVNSKLSLFKKSGKYNEHFFTKKTFGSSLSEANKIRDIILNSIYNSQQIKDLKRAMKSYKSKL